MDRFGHNIRADVKKQDSEISSLPILCETCLGDNPYVRLLREENGKECKVCNNPFTVFRWKPGQRSRYKQTIICPLCAKVKNVCQTCLFDLEYNLPVQIRDKFLESAIVLPENETNRNYQLEQMEKEGNLPSYDKMYRSNIDLKKLRRYDPYFKRNMARVCSFWRKGTCTRGEECPYLHKEIHLDKSLSNQNIKSRYTGQNDVLAEKILKKYDETIKANEQINSNTICIIGMCNDVKQVSIKECFKKFGDIRSIKMVPNERKMYLTFLKPASAKKAYEHYKNGIELNGNFMKVVIEEKKTTQVSNVKGNHQSMVFPMNISNATYNMSHPIMMNSFPSMYNMNQANQNNHCNKPIINSVIPNVITCSPPPPPPPPPPASSAILSKQNSET